MMPKLKLIVNQAAVESFSRRYETDYAGAWRGFCKTRESAILAAMRHVVSDGYTACTITDRYTGHVVARVRLEPGRKSATVTVMQPFKKV